MVDNKAKINLNTDDLTKNREKNPNKRLSEKNIEEIKSLVISNKDISSNYNTEIGDILYTNSPLKKLSMQFIKTTNITNKQKIDCKTSINLLGNNNTSKLSKQSSKKLKNLSENAYNIGKSNTYKEGSLNQSRDSEISEESIDANIEIPNDSEIRIEDPEFESNIAKYYISASENLSGNYDIYITNCLKLITCFQSYKSFDKEVMERKQIIKKYNPTVVWDNNKKLIILDMDETLIHSDLDMKFKAHDEYIKVKEDNKENKDEEDDAIIPLNIRPNLYEFLDFCNEHFEIAIFTASCKDYADAILDFLEKDKKYFKYRFYRDSCINYHNIFIKDMSIFGKNIKDIIIVDNCLLSFAHHLRNGVLITSFYNDSYDMDLVSLIEFFKSSIVKCEDVRDKIDATFEFEKIKNTLKDYNG